MKYLLTILMLSLFAGCGGVYEERIADLEFMVIHLAEEKNIIRIVNTLFIATDNRDWEAVKNVFTEEVLFDVTSMAGGEPTTMTSQQLVNAWDQGFKGLKVIHHQVGNYDVSITGKEADVFCYGIAIHYLPNKTNRSSRMYVGSYNLHLTKIDSAWKINRFKYNLKYIDSNKNLQKAEKKENSKFKG